MTSDPTAGPVRILGIDPGSVRTGVGIIDYGRRAAHCHHAVIATGKGPFPTRLKVIFEGVLELIQEFQPDEVAVESVFMARNADRG